MRFLYNLLNAINPDNKPDGEYSIWDGIVAGCKENKYLYLFLTSLAAAGIGYILVRKYLKKFDKDDQDDKDEK